MLEMTGLRERNRRRAMRETQQAALELFEKRGFTSVTVEEIAASVGTAASTIYRHFGTKEALVLWDEHDAAVVDALADHLGRLPPLTAIRNALIEALAHRYDADLEFQLRRITFIYATRELHAAAVEADFRNRAELTGALERLLPKGQRGAAPILAGAAMLALDVAINRWQSSRAKIPLADLIAEAFDSLARLDELG